MKSFLTLLFAIIFVQFTFGQGTYTESQRKKDKAKLDSICKKSPNSCLNYAEVIGVNSVFRKYAPRKINKTQKICFNKKFEYISTIDGKTTRGCFYINTITGYVALFNTDDRNTCLGMTNPVPGFDMIIASKIGESLTFRINSRGEKFVYSQKPLENIRYGGSINFVVKNVNSLLSNFREPFTNQNLPTLPYFIEGITASSAKYLFGPYYAQRIPLKDYFGVFGLGYYTDGMGNTFISLAVESIDQFIKVVKITDVNECFDGSKFKNGDEENIATNEQSINDRKKGLENEAENASGNSCNAAKTLNLHKTQVLNTELIYNNYVKGGGNPMSKEGLKLGSKAQDVRNEVIKHRLETELKICQTEKNIQTAPSRNSTAGQLSTYQKKLACYNDAVNDLSNLEASLKDIDARQGSNYGKALAEKNVLYFQKMRDINLDCNFKKGKLQENPMNKGANEIGDKLREILKRR
ncbi:hypothetical protein [Kaistella jeonii]|nr:hypothetical protein [Kaistella jeonii]SFB68428.1 hypothetical protein SAMN05421876_10128 [Kaistella jeonii]VEI94637.1 Uncharacterised protein [Kaistella jeonii]